MTEFISVVSKSIIDGCCFVSSEVKSGKCRSCNNPPGLHPRDVDDLCLMRSILSISPYAAAYGCTVTQQEIEGQNCSACNLLKMQHMANLMEKHAYRANVLSMIGISKGWLQQARPTEGERKNDEVERKDDEVSEGTISVTPAVKSKKTKKKKSKQVKCSQESNESV